MPTAITLTQNFTK